MDLSLVFFPSAVLIGALHALEPGHAKTLTAAYLIGTKGTKRDAIILGIAVATTHSFVVIGLSVTAIFLGQEALTSRAESYLAIGSSVAVIVLGGWLFLKRLPGLLRARQAARGKLVRIVSGVSPRMIGGYRAAALGHQPHDHENLSDEEHARAHLADLPDYVQRGERPTLGQIVAFGAVGGLVPCPAAVSVMLLALSVSQSGRGLILVLGFSLGLALTLVGIGLLVVTGISRLASGGKFSRLSMYAPIVSAGMVVCSGLLGLLVAIFKA